MKNTKNFMWNELIHSDTAIARKINNTPPKDLERNGEILIDFLQEIRDAWGSGINVNSGYRCPKLNHAVGGSATSSHMSFLAADIRPSNGNMNEFEQFMSEWAKSYEKGYDQIILEGKGSGRWIHVSPMKKDKSQRKMLFEIR